jgi:hypothetical protein
MTAASTGAGLCVASSSSGDAMSAVAGGCSGAVVLNGVAVLVSGRLSGESALLVLRHFSKQENTKDFCKLETELN